MSGRRGFLGLIQAALIGSGGIATNIYVPKNQRAICRVHGDVGTDTFLLYEGDQVRLAICLRCVADQCPVEIVER